MNTIGNHTMSLAGRLRRRFALAGVVALLIAMPAFGQGLKTCDPLAFEHVRDRTIAPLMSALAAGDVAQITQYLSDRMAERYETLLTRNATYPEYLREHYEGSGWELLNVVAADGDYTAIIEVYWPDGRREAFELELGDNPDLPDITSTDGCR